MLARTTAFNRDRARQERLEYQDESLKVEQRPCEDNSLLSSNTNFYFFTPQLKNNGCMYLILIRIKQIFTLLLLFVVLAKLHTVQSRPQDNGFSKRDRDTTSILTCDRNSFILSSKHKYYSFPDVNTTERRITEEDGYGYKIVGMQNSGTNFLYWMIQHNCVTKIGEKIPNEESPHKHTIWYHHWWDSLPEGKYVVIVKDPFTWLKSMCKVSYSWKLDKKKCPESLLEPIVFHKFKQAIPHTYSSIIDGWNRFYANLLFAWATGKFDIIFIRYEDLLLHTNEEMERVCKFKGYEIREDFQILRRPSKKHGNSNNYKIAIGIYTDLTYRNNWDSDIRSKIDGLLNQTIVSLFGYNIDYDQTEYNANLMKNCSQ